METLLGRKANRETRNTFEIPTLAPGRHAFMIRSKEAQRTIGLSDALAEMEMILKQLIASLSDQKANYIASVPIGGTRGGFVGLLAVAEKAGARSSANEGVLDLPEGYSFLNIRSKEASKFGLRDIPKELTSLLDELVSRLPQSATVTEIHATPSVDGTTVGFIVTVKNQTQTT